MTDFDSVVVKQAIWPTNPTTKGKEEGKANGSYFAGKGQRALAWSQQPNGIKSLCAIAERPRAQVDLEGFAKPSKTVRPKAGIFRATVKLRRSVLFWGSPKPKEHETEIIHVKESSEKSSENSTESVEIVLKELRITKRQKGD